MPKRYSMLSISMIRNLFGDRLSRPEIYRCSGGFYQTGKFIGIDFYDPEYIGADFHDPEFIGVDFQRMSEFIGIQWKFNRYLSISLFSTRGTRAKRGNLISLRFIDNTFFNYSIDNTFFATHWYRSLRLRVCHLFVPPLLKFTIIDPRNKEHCLFEERFFLFGSSRISMYPDIVLFPTANDSSNSDFYDAEIIDFRCREIPRNSTLNFPDYIISLCYIIAAS